MGSTRQEGGANLLLLTDGRLPNGGHAHSGGLEAAIGAGLVSDLASLQCWLAGRLATTGTVDAAFAAVAFARTTPWAALVDEWDARTPSPALRAASRSQGRGLARVARRCWPGPASPDEPDVLPWPLALGAAGRRAGLGLAPVTLAAASASVSGPAWAATRLLGVDPFGVAAALAALAAEIDAVATAAMLWAASGKDGRDLPAPAAPLLDLGAEWHDRWEVRLFAS